MRKEPPRFLNSAAGHTRAYALLHGAPLPHPGSFKERVLAESILRERNEKFTLVSLFIRVLGATGKLEDKVISDLLEEYKEELYQFRYNSKYKSIRERVVAREARKADEMARIMSKVDKMTVTDEDIRQVQERE